MDAQQLGHEDILLLHRGESILDRHQGLRDGAGLHMGVREHAQILVVSDALPARKVVAEGAPQQRDALVLSAQVRQCPSLVHSGQRCEARELMCCRELQQRRAACEHGVGFAQRAVQKTAAHPDEGKLIDASAALRDGERVAVALLRLIDEAEVHRGGGALRERDHPGIDDAAAMIFLGVVPDRALEMLET
ncbi:MAG: hypothetical protein ACREMQ_12540, partial [Longimicrobiales bacterium]